MRFLTVPTSPRFYRSSVNHFDGQLKSKPAVNIRETDSGYSLEFAAPGLKKEDFVVKVEDGFLTVKAGVENQKTETDNKYFRHEFSFGTFSRSFKLPDTVDVNNIKANYSNGILQLELAFKPEAKPVSRVVEVA